MKTPVTDAVFALMELGVTGEALRAALERIETAAYESRFDLDQAVVIATAREDLAHLEAKVEARKERDRAYQAKRRESLEIVRRRPTSSESDDPLETKVPPTPPSKPSEPNGSSGKLPARVRASRRCPADWRPTSDDLAVGAAEGFSPGEIERELAKFRDHTFGTPKSDWSATFRNWLRNAKPPRKAHDRPDRIQTPRDDRIGRMLAGAVAAADG